MKRSFHSVNNNHEVKRVLVEYMNYIKSNISKLMWVYFATLIPSLISGFSTNLPEVTSLLISAMPILQISQQNFKKIIFFCLSNCVISISFTCALLHLFRIPCDSNFTFIIFKCSIIVSVMYLSLKKCSKESKSRIFSLIFVFIFIAAISRNI